MSKMLKVSDFTKLYWITSESFNKCSEPKLDRFGQFLESLESSGIEEIGYFNDGRLTLVDDTGLFEILLYEVNLTFFYIDSGHYIIKMYEFKKYDELYLNDKLLFKQEPVSWSPINYEYTFKF